MPIGHWNHWRTLFVLAAVAAAGVSVTSGLIVSDLRQISPDEQAWDVLGGQPRTDAVQARQDRIAESVRGALYDEVAAFDWTLLVPPTLVQCDGPPGAIGDGHVSRRVVSGTWSGTPIPRRNWPAAFRALEHGLEGEGFTAVDLELTGPDEQRLSIDDSQGTTLVFTLQPTSTTFGMESACALLPGVRKRGL